MDIRAEMFAMRDEGYAAFQLKLTPGMTAERIIGVRVPQLRALAKRVRSEGEADGFLDQLPHEYYDENMLHSILLGSEKDFDRAVERVNAFLPHVDNWAVCDTLGPKVFAKHKAELLPIVKGWAASKETYTCRFGVDMLMTHWLDADFSTEYADIVAGIRSEEYYVNMMCAWYFATALAKQWDAVSPYVAEGRLTPWVRMMTVRKARESFRVPQAHKDALKEMADRLKAEEE